MFYNFRDFKVLLNNVEVFANSVQLSVSNSLTPVYEINNRHTSKYTPTNGLVGNLRLSYYLTGQDPLKTYITNEKDVISGNLGGLYFESGYLNTYSFEGANNSPVVINSDIIFFSNIEGTFNPISTPPQNIENKVLNFSDASISSSSENFPSGLGNIVSFSYNFSNSITPIYALTTGENADNVIIDKVIFGIKQISSEIITDDLNLNLPDLDVDLQNGLISYWTLNETDGTRLDSTTTNNDLIAVNSPEHVANGKVGNALYLNGNISAIRDTTPTNLVVLVNGVLTLAGWFQARNSLVHGALLVSAYESYPLGIQWALQILTGGIGNRYNLFFQTIGLVDWNLATTGGSAILNEWVFIIAVIDDINKEMKLSLNNGAFVVLSYTGNPNTNFASDPPVQFGATNGGVFAQHGYYDEWGIWNRELTENEISYLYNNGNGRSLF